MTIQSQSGAEQKDLSCFGQPTQSPVKRRVFSRCSWRQISCCKKWLIQFLLLVFGLHIAPSGSQAELMVSEIMYHPWEATSVQSGVDDALEDTNGEPGEFLELVNHGSSILNLSGFAWSDGIEFTFPEGAQMQPGSFLVLVKDPGLWSDSGISNLYGPYSGSLSNAGERLRLKTPSGATVIDQEYRDHGDWPAEADGAGHSLVFPYHLENKDPSDPRDWTPSRLRFGSPGAVDDPGTLPNDPITLVGPGSPGHYFKGFAEPSGGNTAWAGVDFIMDSDWISAPAGYGYSSDAGELLRVRTELPDMRGNYSSVYARIEFQVTARQIDQMEELSLSMQYDDGFVVYLNGNPVASVSVNGNPPAFDTPANSASDYPEYIVNLNEHISQLTPGTNLLAVQGHNGHLSDSSDFVIGPLLEAKMEPVLPDSQRVRAIQINEIYANGPVNDPDWVEFYNPTDTDLDLSGYYLSDNADRLDRYTLPTGSVIPAGGFLSFSAEAFGFGISSNGEALFLTEPGMEFVVAAYGFGPQLNSHSLARFPDGSDDWFFSATPTRNAANAAGPISPARINEIHYNALQGQEIEFVEIKNRSQEPLSVGNWKFRGIRQELDAERAIPAGGFLVVADDAQAAAEYYQLGEDLLAGSFSGSLSNGGERIALLNADDVVMDWVDYQDTPPWPVTADGFGASLERVCESDQWNAPGDWSASPVNAPSPGRENSRTDCPEVQRVGLWINEIHYHPFAEHVDDRELEFVEIYNATGETVSLAGWGIGGDVEYIFESDSSLAPGGFLVIASVPERIQEVYELNAATMAGPYAGDLPDGGGEVFLFRPDGRVEDWVDYNDNHPWPSLADGFGSTDLKGYSLERVRYSEDSGPQDWKASLSGIPTPQNQNSQQVLDASEPSVISIKTLPEQPTSLDVPILEVITRYGSLDDSLRVEYWVDDPELGGETVQSTPMDSQRLRDESDAIIWTAALPTQAENSIVRYRITRLSGIQWTPLDPQPDSDAFAWHAYFVKPVNESSQYETVRLFISSADWIELIVNTAAGRVSNNVANPRWNNEVPAVFVGDGQVFDVTVRHQGSRWNRNNAQWINFPCASHVDGQAHVRSWRIRFPSYRKYQGIDTLILQKQGGWPQRVSFRFFEQAGVPAPITGYRNLMINGCDFNPDAFMIERPGADLVERWFGEVGDLFKSQGFTGDEGPWSWGDARLIQGSRNGYTESERYEYTYNRKTLGWKNSELDRVPDIVEPMIEGLHQARAGGTQVLREFLAANFDVDKTLRYMCAINYVGTFDDMFQNHYLYRDAVTGKWQMFPWDMDNTLGGAFGETNAHPFRGVDESRYGNVGNRSGWWNRIKDSFFIAYPEEFVSLFYYLNNNEFSPEAMRPVVEEIALEGGFGTGTVNSLMNHITARHNYLNSALPTLVQPQAPELFLERSFEDNRLKLSWLAHPVFELETNSAADPDGWEPLIQPQPWVESDRLNGGLRILEMNPFAERLFFRLKQR